MPKPVFDINDGDFILSAGKFGVDSAGNMMMRVGYNTAIDMDSGTLHFVSSRDDEDED